MKNTSTLVISTIFLCITILTQAQEKSIPINEPDYNKPKLFQNLPDRIAVDASMLENLFSLDVNHAASINTAGIQFQGNVSSKNNISNDVTHSSTIIIGLTNYPGANFTLTKTSKPDGTINYAGRIISFQHGDLFELQNQKGNWALVKRNYYELINE